MGCNGSKQASMVAGALNSGAAQQQQQPQQNQQQPAQAQGPAAKLTPSMTGAKKSVLIGINYIGQQGELRGCINDVKIMKQYLTTCGFPSTPDSQIILIEEHGYQPPTRRNIVDAMKWLTANARPGDNLFLHYSGHGGQVADKDGDESDGKDETLVPLDYTSAGQITDDEIYDLLVKSLPKGSRLTVVLDCCHSGTAMDLPYIFKASEGATTAPGAALSGNSVWLAKIIKLIAQYYPPAQQFLDSLGGGRGVGGILQKFAGLSGLPGIGQLQALAGTRSAPDPFESLGKLSPVLAQETTKIRDNMAEVLMFSGCQDKQTSADVGSVQGVFQLPPSLNSPGGAGGACTNALLTVLNQNQAPQTFLNVLEQMRTLLKQKNFSQVPQLSCSLKIDISQELFTLVPK
eukprot:TRINITY_DN42325_c0_g1_i1.p1 TRINITY_DN42325_c0_g1~~TRINITY_DN42325_c0_g1_i1.p1  ORF type:complete len:403 (+),score=54.76 TRINITY_DN42325_c0_g1_i1:38-1246(+)